MESKQASTDQNKSKKSEEKKTKKKQRLSSATEIRKRINSAVGRKEVISLKLKTNVKNLKKQLKAEGVVTHQQVENLLQTWYSSKTVENAIKLGAAYVTLDDFKLSHRGLMLLQRAVAYAEKKEDQNTDLLFDALKAWAIGLYRCRLFESCIAACGQISKLRPEDPILEPLLHMAKKKAQRKFLVCMDGSEEGEKAFNETIPFLKKGDIVYLLALVNKEELDTYVKEFVAYDTILWQETRERAETILRKAVQTCEHRNITYFTLADCEDPREAIVDIVEVKNIHFLVMGSSLTVTIPGFFGSKKAVLKDQLLDKVKCDLFIVKGDTPKH